MMGGAIKIQRHACLARLSQLGLGISAMKFTSTLNVIIIFTVRAAAAVLVVLAILQGGATRVAWGQTPPPTTTTENSSSTAADASEADSAAADPESMLPHFKSTRLNDSTEILVDIEEAGGAALSAGFGLAGNTDLDIVRNPSLSKEPYLGRAIIHKVFALSKDKVKNQRNFLSLFDELPRRRLEIRFGKFSMPDFFDQNSVGTDTHFQFNNWSVDNNGAWDYAADTRGYTVGLVADYEDRNWGFRFAEALMPKVANGIDLVWRPWQVHAENWEYELRHGVLPGKPGVIRILAYTNYANMGIYRDAVAQFREGLVTAPDITNHPWRVTRKFGFGINLEQSLARNFTAYARWGWDNGKTESFAYTEIDSTFNQGIGVNGALWHRTQDRAGVAFVSNGIKKDHQIYLTDGGQGFLLGDGGLNYGRENIVESYYTAHVWRGIYIAPGVQHINNPGYNRDRGPVVVPTLRAHVEF
jgi:high affinity Mn2+ porin